jgi:two-component system OmpR family sensor kinase
MNHGWGWSRLSIFGRTFLLMLAALLICEAIGLALVFNPPAARDAPVRLTSVARALHMGAPDGAPSFMGPGPQDGPGRPPEEPMGNDSGRGPPPDSPGPPPDYGFTLTTASAAPAPAGLQTASQLRTALAAKLGIDPASVVFFATAADQPDESIDSGSDNALLRKSFLAARHLRDGRWLVVEHRVAGFPSALQQRAMLLLALGIAALLPLAWLFAHALSAPISRFAEAALRFGRDANGPLLPREGPAEMLLAVDSFNAMQARLNRMLQERTHMIGAIAHDLRTPLTRLAFRLDDLPSPLAEKVNADIQEMKSMISAALDFIRDRSLNTSRERLDFRLLVESIVDDQRDLEHDVTLEPGTPITLDGNRVSLRRLVSNLLDNALKYGERARLRLHVELSLCVLEIDDDGLGIPEQMQQRVFDPFFRIEASRNRDTGGFGLGLASVHAIVLDHGGEITLANRRGGGLRVTVRLPDVRD